MNIQEKELSFFPIKSLQSFIDLVEEHITSNEGGEPNLAFLSILFGYLEHELTVNRLNVSDRSSESENDNSKPGDASKDVDVSSDAADFPTLHLEIVEGLLEQFILMVKAEVDRSLADFTTRSGCATKQLCKRVSDLIWNGLLRSYHKDKAHIQSLFSYLTGRQLDCFGLAFVVVAACQVLNYKNVHLVLSGDHAWAACGEDSKEMVEITWHGRGSEDRRGFIIDKSITDKNWIYHGGKAVKCDRWMELVALLVSINPSIDIHKDSVEMQLIQHKVLQSLYKRGHLDKYPASLGLYCELAEAINPGGSDSSDLIAIHNKSLVVVATLYDDLHILPYCGKGHYCLRQGMYKEAIKCWAKAAQVASKYNYGKEDEEIYKEMIDIANDLMPQALKGDSSLCNDTECYYDVINFYDGICLWEEGSSTPVLHSWWARYFTLSVSKFVLEVREFFKDHSSDDDAAVSEVGSACDDSDSASRRSGKGHRLKSSSDTTGVDGNAGDKVKGHETVNRLASPELSSPSGASEVSPGSDAKVRKPVSRLHLCSQKMKALKDMLTSGKKINSQAVGLLLTAQSQVHFVKRRSNTGDYSMEYGGSKRTRRSRDFDT